MPLILFVTMVITKLCECQALKAMTTISGMYVGTCTYTLGAFRKAREA